MLRFDTFQQIMLKHFNYFHILRLWGIGEPLLNPEIFDMIRFEKERGNRVNLSTNGMLLHRQHIKALLESKLDKLNISIDSVDPQEYEYIRRGANFATLEANLAELHALRQQTRSPLKVSVTAVAMKSNTHILLHFIPFLKKYGIRRLSVQVIQLNRPGIEFTKEEDIQRVHNIVQALASYEKRFKQEGITLSVPAMNFSGIRKN